MILHKQRIIVSNRSIAICCLGVYEQLLVRIGPKLGFIFIRVFISEI